MIIEVDMYRYCELKGIRKEEVRGGDYIHDYADMDVTPEELKWLIDNCVDIRMKNNE